MTNYHKRFTIAQPHQHARQGAPKLSFVSIAVATVGTFATSEASYSVEVTLVYAPLVQEGTFQLWIGSTESGVFWTTRLDMLHRAFASPGISVEEGTFAITAIDCGIAFTLPAMLLQCERLRWLRALALTLAFACCADEAVQLVVGDAFVEAR